MTAVERGRAGDDHSMRVAESDIGAHGDEFVGKKHAGFVHPVVKQH